MFLQSLSLQNFRNYKKSSFTFDPFVTIIVGPNTSGKSNLLEAITFLSKGKSKRAEKDLQAVTFGKELARVKGIVGEKELEVILTQGTVAGIPAPLHKFLVNGVAKRRVDFAAFLPTILFSPADLDMIIGGPGLRRDFLDDVLEQVDREYRFALTSYIKALRQRNALLQQVLKTGIRNNKQFEYWDALLITHGTTITKAREDFILFINTFEKTIFPLSVSYESSIMSSERLLQYRDAEVALGATLVGPQRDDFRIFMTGKMDIKAFGSRGQQRLAVLQLKLLQLTFVREHLGEKPLLLLDDIFSELDSGHIHLVQDMIGSQQTILTTTHEEFISQQIFNEKAIIHLQVS
ncbi:MAG: DNA replication and repair protein RecF [Candidatus Levybacteria bacterium]|nr:DNA replication and repair protein RecF [Candidatus Levybacteria bacterium]